MKNANYEFWFVAGSQHLYGEEQLKNVARDAEDIVKKLNASGKLPYPIVFKGVMTTADGITKFMKEVNYQDNVAGVMAWMHTFSPAKNWIRGEVLLQKPLLHLAPQDNDAKKFEHNVRYQLREYLGIKKFLDDRGYTAFCTNFEDLKGLEQLPGLASQLLMRDGYGFGAEGDWKTAALTRLLKILAHNDRTVFMEDYTLDLRKGHEAILGSHMLEVDPTIASDQPRVEVHPLDIGDKDDPARLVFTGADGKGVDVTVADFRDGFRMIYYPVDCHKAEAETPHLPVAKQLWTPTVGLREGATKWIQAGGGHHTVLSFHIQPQQIRDLVEMLGVTLVEIA